MAPCRLYLPLLVLGERSHQRFHMPAAQFKTAANAILRTARLIWTLHHTLQQVFDSHMIALLETR